MQHGNLTELPVSNVVLTTAIGKKSTTIKKQILYEISIGDLKYISYFLVVPRLSNPVVIGNDWLLGNKVIIKYECNAVTVSGVSIPSSFLRFSGVPSERLLVSEGKDAITYIQTVDSLKKWRGENTFLYTRFRSMQPEFFCKSYTSAA